jgi:hypothetical protein
MSPSEYFKEYLTNIDKILFDTPNKIFDDMEEYSTTCDGGMMFFDDNSMMNQMDELSNERWQQNYFCKKLN